jgi:hypothetical protein
VLEEECAECRFNDRCEHVAVLSETLELHLGLLRSALDEAPAEVERPRHLCAGGARDDVGTHLREPPFRKVRVARIERVRDRKLEDAVAEELEPLVRGATVARPRGVGEDRLGELRRERVDQLREVGVRGYWCELT